MVTITWFDFSIYFFGLLIFLILFTALIRLYTHISLYKYWSKNVNFKWNRGLLLTFSFSSFVFLFIIIYLIYFHDHFKSTAIGKWFTLEVWSIGNYSTFLMSIIGYSAIPFFIGLLFQYIIWNKDNILKITINKEEDARIWYSYLVFLYLMGVLPGLIFAYLFSTYYHHIGSFIILFYANGFIDTSAWYGVYREYKSGNIEKPLKISKEYISSEYKYFRLFWFIEFIKKRGVSGILIRYSYRKLCFNLFWISKYLSMNFSLFGCFLYLSYQLFTIYIFLLITFYALSKWKVSFWITWGFCLNKRRFRFTLIYIFFFHQLLFLFFPAIILICFLIVFNNSGNWKVRDSFNLFDHFVYHYLLFHYLKIEPIWTTLKDGRVYKEETYLEMFINFIVMSVTVYREEKIKYEAGKVEYEAAIERACFERREEYKNFLNRRKLVVSGFLKRVINLLISRRIFSYYNHKVVFSFLNRTLISMFIKIKKVFRWLKLNDWKIFYFFYILIVIIVMYNVASSGDPEGIIYRVIQYLILEKLVILVTVLTIINLLYLYCEYLECRKRYENEGDKNEKKNDEKYEK